MTDRITDGMTGRVVGRRFGRRALLGGALAATATAGVDAWAQGFAPGAAMHPSTAYLALRYLSAPTFVRTLRRREDAMLVRLLGYNLAAEGGELVRPVDVLPSVLVVEFGPQAIAEAGYAASQALGTPPIPRRIAGPSRVAFEVPASALPLPLTAAALTDWSAWRLRTVPAAEDPVGLFTPPVDVRTPTAQETALELPWRLQLSPPSTTAFVTDGAPITSTDGVSSLWHARMAARRPLGRIVDQLGILGRPDEFRPGMRVRAVWAVPAVTTADETPFEPLNHTRRGHLVTLTTSGARRAAQAERLWLSPLGGWLDVDGEWPDSPVDVDLVGWEHEIAQGRDQRVRVVETGFLFPWGHRAARVEIAERLFLPSGGRTGAYLRRRTFLVIAQRTRRYGAADALGHPDDGRRWPLRSLSFALRTTPDLHQPGRSFGGFTPADVLICDLHANTPVQLDATGTDWDGRPVRLSVPTAFVRRSVVFGQDGFNRNNELVVEFGEQEAMPRELDLAGQRVALARSLRPGDTSVDVRTFRVGAEVAEGVTAAALLAAGQAPFFPTMVEAGVRIPGAAQATTSPGGGGAPAATEPVIVFDDTYLQQGFEDATEYLETNAAGVFATTKAYAQAKLAGALADFVGDTLPVPAELAGAIANPSVALTGLARELGVAGGILDAVGDLPGLKAGTFDPAAVLAGGAELLGGIKLTDILKKVGLPTALPDVPTEAGFEDGPLRIITRTIGPPPTPPSDQVDVPIPQPPTAIETLIDFRPMLEADPAGLFQPHKIDGLAISSRSLVDLTGTGTSTAEAVGTLDDFTIRLFGDGALSFIHIRFNRLRFEARTGSKVVLDPDIGEVTFQPPLDFVNDLRNYMKGACIVPGIDVSPTGVRASYDVELPAIGVGIFTLSNVRLGAGFDLPFTGGPARAIFGFSSREDPFTLAVGIFGGGGYVALALGTDGIERVEVSLEFGAMTSLNLVVASGSISLTAGISFLRELVADGNAPGGEVARITLTGFVKLRGELDVLGLVTLSVTLEISVAYDDADGSVVGRGILVLEVDVLLLSETFEVEVEKRFGGAGGAAGGGQVQQKRAPGTTRQLSAGEPQAATFATQLTQPDWDAYAAAFA